MKLDKETQEKIQELQLAEQNLQNLLMQKQAFQIELNEAESSLHEAKGSSEEIYKIAGQIMLKAKKSDIISELTDKIKIINLRLKAIENHEKNSTEKAEKLRSEIESKLNLGKK